MSVHLGSFRGPMYLILVAEAPAAVLPRPSGYSSMFATNPHSHTSLSRLPRGFTLQQTSVWLLGSDGCVRLPSLSPNEDPQRGGSDVRLVSKQNGVEIVGPEGQGLYSFQRLKVTPSPPHLPSSTPKLRLRLPSL